MHITFHLLHLYIHIYLITIDVILLNLNRCLLFFRGGGQMSGGKCLGGICPGRANVGGGGKCRDTIQTNMK